MSKAVTIELHVTKDYEKLKLIHGNREISKNHVARLKRKIESDGNLTSEFPINVNERMEIIDGQHRVIALKELDYPVYYTISKGASLATVRQVNVARQNWSWKDYASSYAAEGNTNYKDVLDFYHAFKFHFHTVAKYAGGERGKQASVFNSGNFKILNKGLTYKLLGQLSDIREVMPFPIRESASSGLYDIMTHPDYDHKRMIDKLTRHGSQLHEWRLKKDWMRSFEDIYNINQGEASRVRFF